MSKKLTKSQLNIPPVTSLVQFAVWLLLVLGVQKGYAQIKVVVKTKPANCTYALGCSIELQVSGGVEPYSYAWSNGFTEKDLKQVAPGKYSVTVTDDTGKKTTVTEVVKATPTVEIKSEVTPASDVSAQDGKITIQVSGGNPPYAFHWFGPHVADASTQNLNNLLPGKYLLVVQDQNKCNSTLEVNVNSLNK